MKHTTSLERATGLRTANELDSVLLGRIPLVAEVGEAAEQEKSLFSQANKQVVAACEKITGRIISK